MEQELVCLPPRARSIRNYNKVEKDKKMKHDQRGIAHLALIIGAALVIGIIGFAGFRVVNNQSSSQIQKSDNTPSAKVPEKSPLTETEQKTEVTQPVNKSTPAPQAPPPKSTPQTRSISFTKGGGTQNGDVVSVSANLSENQTGTCTYSFSLNGTERVKQTSAISNTNACSKEIPVSSFPKSANYSFTLTYLSSDGLVSASQAAYDIEVR